MLLSGIALIILSPVIMIVCFLELIFHGRPIIYRTKRPGKNGKVFELYKFRSMLNIRGKDGLLIPEKDRITRFGMFIRRFSIDEIPGLVNVLKGDMSIVGPRPLLVEYLQYYSPRHAMRQSVRPGLTIERIIDTGSKTWTWRDQFENDIWYIQHISFMTDVRMVFAILESVIKGSETRTSDTRVPFDGTNLDEVRGRDELGVEKHFESLERD